MKAVNTEGNEKVKGNAGKGRVIWKKVILAKSDFNLDVKWERDC